MNKHVETNAEGHPMFFPPKKLSKKSPIRLLSIDKLEQGEEILPKDFVLIFSPEWMTTEVTGINKLYQKVLPVIGICGKAVFLNSKYEGGAVDTFLKKYRRR